jgi:hypothetical protein
LPFWAWKQAPSISLELIHNHLQKEMCKFKSFDGARETSILLLYHRVVLVSFPSWDIALPLARRQVMSLEQHAERVLVRTTYCGSRILVP